MIVAANPGGVIDMHKDDRALLDLLCLAAPATSALDRMFRLRTGWGEVLDRLRMKGLVAFESLSPSPSALQAYEERRAGNPPPLPSAPPPPAPPLPAATDKAPDWTPAEDEALRAAYKAGETIEVVAAALGRTECGARSRAAKIGLSGSHASGRGGFVSSPDWTAEEDARLREAYGKVETPALAAELGRATGTIYSRAFALGIRHGKHRAWSDEELSALEIADRRGLSLTDVAAALDRKFYGVCKYAENLGYRFGRRPRVAVHLTLADILALRDPGMPTPAFKRQERPDRVRQPEPWSDERKALFLETLESSGSIDAAVVKVGLAISSRRAAYRQRHRDADFAAGWDEALRRSPYRPGPKPKALAAAAPKEPKPARGKGWNDRLRQDAFVAAYRRTGWVKPALVEMGLAPSNDAAVAKARRECPDFDRRCTEALEERRIERDTMRAIAGFAQAAKGLLTPPPAPRPERVRRPRPRLSKPAEAPQLLNQAERIAPPPLQPARSTKPGAIAARGGWDNGWRGRDHQEPPKRHKTDAQIAAENLAYLEERRRIDRLAATRSVDLGAAKLALQRRGHSVYRASVAGGRADRWVVSGMGKDVTDEQLIEAAERILANA